MRSPYRLVLGGHCEWDAKNRRPFFDLGRVYDRSRAVQFNRCSYQQTELRQPDHALLKLITPQCREVSDIRLPAGCLPFADVY